VLAIVAAWASIALGKGLFSPAMVVVGNIAAVTIFLWKRRALLRRLLRARIDESVLSWRTEVWSFQWKIGITWLCSYFTVQVLTPVLFASRGAIEAGKLGMSLSIAAYSWNLVFAWMSTKAAPFGQLVARRDYASLDKLFFQTLWRSLVVLGALVVVCLVGILLLQRYFQALASRMVSPALFVLLLLGAVGTLVVQSEAIYLRAHKEEPLLWQAIVVAVLTSTGAYLAAPRWGLVGICVVYFICSGIIGVTSASLIFRSQRRLRSRTSPSPARVSLEAVS